MKLSKTTKTIRRQRIIKKYIKVDSVKILEIGALDKPTFNKDSVDITFADWFDGSELYEKTKNNLRRKVGKIVALDYVIKNKHFAEDINKKFDLIIANHVIEHIPDPINWLGQTEKLLQPKGVLFLAIPDRRFMFDYLRRETNFTDLLRAYDEDLIVPTKYQIFDAKYYKRDLFLKDFLDGSYSSKIKNKRFSVTDAIKISQKLQDQYVSLHCNVFTYHSFFNLFNEIKEAGLTNLEILKAQDVQENDTEFKVLLKMQT